MFSKVGFVENSGLIVMLFSKSVGMFKLNTPGCLHCYNNEKIIFDNMTFSFQILRPALVFFYPMRLGSEKTTSGLFFKIVQTDDILK